MCLRFGCRPLTAFSFQRCLTALVTRTLKMRSHGTSCHSWCAMRYLLLDSLTTIRRKRKGPKEMLGRTSWASVSSKTSKRK